FADVGELAAALDDILARHPASARVPVPMTTLPGSGPHAFLCSPDGDEATSVDAVPPQVFEPAWAPAMVAGTLFDPTPSKTAETAALRRRAPAGGLRGVLGGRDHGGPDADRDRGPEARGRGHDEAVRLGGRAGRRRGRHRHRGREPHLTAW